MVYQYAWKVKNIFPVKADVVGKHIENLQKEQGVVTSKNLLESARPKNSAIHDCYEWDDSIAAEKYRLEQSKNIMTNLARVVISNDGKTEKVVRAFVNIEENKGFTPGRFVDVRTALSNEETRQIVLKKALDELLIFKSKYEGFQELSEIFNDIEQLEKSIV